jgi:hypothetical protein
MTMEPPTTDDAGPSRPTRRAVLRGRALIATVLDLRVTGDCSDVDEGAADGSGDGEVLRHALDEFDGGRPLECTCAAGETGGGGQPGVGRCSGRRA